MESNRTWLSSLLAEYVDAVFEDDPIEASVVGRPGDDGMLPDLTPDAIQAALARRRSFLVRLESIDPAGLTRDDAIDVRLAISDARTYLRGAEEMRWWERCPYWYVERLGDAVQATVLGGDVAALDERLAAIPRYLDAATRNLSAACPVEYVDMGIVAAEGLASLVGRGLAGVASDARAAAAADRIESFAGFLRELRPRCRGTWVAGAGYFDHLLREMHLMELDAEGLRELGEREVVRDRAELERCAAAFDPGASWREQLARAERHHATADTLRQVYRDAVGRARAHVIEADLVSVPEGEECVVEWLPDYLRSSIPMGLMKTTPAFAPGLSTRFLLTRPGPDWPSRQRSHALAFVDSIAGHETYPGHHLQKVHHKLGSASSAMRRCAASPSMMEGWGLYVEDLEDETGFAASPEVTLFRRRNRLWRSMRVVIDTGLHTGRIGIEQATSLLVDEVGMEPGMARGEVLRYVRHDNPTYPSSYLLGRRQIHALREAWRAGPGRPSLRAFHDRFLSFGSIPVALSREAMLAGQGSGLQQAQSES
jgi:uncharacterized protein (DUF885 family)